MNGWFGEPWPAPDYRAPVCEDDAFHVETPVGAECVQCQEAIEEGDRGTLMSVVTAGPTVHVQPVHAECSLRSVMGNHVHVAGKCRFVGDCSARSTLSYRNEARAVWDMTVLTDVRTT